MKSIFELCSPRESVFNGQNRDDVLDLTNLLDNSIDVRRFFDETYKTEGMKDLIEKAFQRFNGTLDRGMLRLSQSMGGGKTHCLIALGLLAKNRDIRHEQCGGRYDNIGDINVVAFSGRETDAPGYLWGAIADQLGKRDFLRDYYNPPQAPGQTTWQNLLTDDKPTLILLDEIPYYLDAMRNYPSAQGTVANIVQTALTNLFNAVSRTSNVLIVLSELSGNYERGGQLIEAAYHDLDRECERFALSIDPVGAQNDDLYNILKKKCFETVPHDNDSDVEEIASAYRTAREMARQMGATLEEPESIYSGIKASYPFHPSLKKIFERFRGNATFQQTRGCIRLVRNMVRCLWQGEELDDKYLINAYDVDLRDSETYSTVRDIKSQLTDAISNDIVAKGETPAKAEECDAGKTERTTEAVAKMLLMSSLSTKPGGLIGLSKSDIAAFMVSPTFSVANLSEVLSTYRAKAWYLYEENDKFFFKDTKNIRADLEERRHNYADENRKAFVRSELEKMFAPRIKNVYQRVLVFPDTTANLDKSDVTLMIVEPNPNSAGLRNEFRRWYEEQAYKNRVCFLTGSRYDMGELYDIAAQNLAIEAILSSAELQALADNDPQKKEARDLKNSKYKDFQSALREIFTSLYFPMFGELKQKTVKLRFDDNNFQAEEQIYNALCDERKFTEINTTDNRADEEFRCQIEDRLFTAQRMTWTDIETRAADNDSWCWCRPGTLKEARARYIQQGFWAEVNGGMIDKNPPKQKTSVQVRENRIDGEITLRITPSNGDIVRYEVGEQANPETSMQIPTSELTSFHPKDNKLWFVCVDSTGQHEIGEQVAWENKCICKYQLADNGDSRIAYLETDGKNVEIHYTTDGTSPLSPNAGIYHDYITLPRGNIILQAVTYCRRYNVWGTVMTSPTINNTGVAGETGGFVINNNSPIFIRKNIQRNSARDAFELLNTLEKYGAQVDKISVNFELDSQYTTYEFGGKYTPVSEVSTRIKNAMSFFEEGASPATSLSIGQIKFDTGERFRSWISEMRMEVREFEGAISQ